MEYSTEDALLLLQRTPTVLTDLLKGLPDRWTRSTEGPDTWSPFDVIGHLIHADRTDWLTRAEHLLKHGDAVPFPVFDREAMFAASEGQSLGELLETFVVVRAESIARLKSLNLTEADLGRRGTHPEFGAVTLRQHLATWVAHDFTHINQIVRTLALQYSVAVGPWRAYLSVLR
jgi:DinB superfamily